MKRRYSLMVMVVLVFSVVYFTSPVLVTADSEKKDKEKVTVEEFRVVRNNKGEMEVTGFVSNNSMGTLLKAKIRIDFKFRRSVMHHEYVIVNDVFPFSRKFFGITVEKGNFDRVKYKITSMKLEY